MNPRLFVAALFLGVALALPARADLGFQFADSTGTPTSTINLDVGAVADVRLYLVETGDNPGNLLSSFGLLSAGVSVSFSPIAAVTSVGGIAPNPAFLNLPGDTEVQYLFSSNTFAGFVGDVGIVDPPLFPEAGNRILLGTFTFRGQSPGSVTIEARDNDADPFIVDTITGPADPNTLESLPLDDLIGLGQAQIVVRAVGNVVPEPTSLALAGAGGLTWLAGALWRRRKANQKCEGS